MARFVKMNQQPMFYPHFFLIHMVHTQSGAAYPWNGEEFKGRKKVYNSREGAQADWNKAKKKVLPNHHLRIREIKHEWTDYYVPEEPIVECATCRRQLSPSDSKLLMPSGHIVCGYCLEVR